MRWLNMSTVPGCIKTILGCTLFPLVLLPAGCGDDEDDLHEAAITGDAYVVLAWSEVGMHFLNPTYTDAVLMPPYSTVLAQVIERGNPPRIVTAGVALEYRILGNTHSYGKTDAWGGDFAPFWDNAEALFGVVLPQDQGLNLVEPEVHNGLSGTMRFDGDHYRVDGIPVTPVNDVGDWNPYQIVEITVRDPVDEILAQTQATVPTSDEISCMLCHGLAGSGTGSIDGGTGNVFHNILASHDALHGTTLVDQKPVLCANCHPSPALNGPTGGHPAFFLSAVIHGSHADAGAACYDCHPGQATLGHRSAAHTAADGNCVACHGDLAHVAQTIVSGERIPWRDEPACTGCHADVQGVATGDVLYRDATGHGGLSCAACHGSPHAMVPSRLAADNYQARQYQSRVKTLGSCGVCHGNSRGDGSEEFGEEHGGSEGKRTACHVCHTSVSARTADWPHAYTWRRRGGGD